MQTCRHISRTVFIVLVAALTTVSAWAISNNPDPGIWGVEGGIVYAIVRSGDVVYLGGSFTSLVSPNGSTTLPADGLAAIDANTGQPTDWRPVANGTVFALAASVDGSEIYVGGTFSTIDGVARSKFAAISPNGNLLTSAGVLRVWFPQMVQPRCPPT